MFDAAIRLVDRIIQLSEYKQITRRRTFEDVIQPIFEDVLEVHGDYAESFLFLTRWLSEQKPGEVSLEDVRREIEDRRIGLEAVRVKVAKMLEVLGEKGKHKDSQVGPFLTAVGRYLFGVSEPIQMIFSGSTPTSSHCILIWG